MAQIAQQRVGGQAQPASPMTQWGGHAFNGLTGGQSTGGLTGPQVKQPIDYAALARLIAVQHGSATSPASPVNPNPPATASATSPTIQPFLTPQEQTQRDTQLSNTDYAIQELNDTLMQDQGRHDVQSAQLQHANDIAVSNENQVAAARGVFNSSISAGNLADLATTLTVRQGLLDTSLRNAELNTAREIGRLRDNQNIASTGWGMTSVQNAQAEQPVINPSSPMSPGGNASQSARPTSIGSQTRSAHNGRRGALTGPQVKQPRSFTMGGLSGSQIKNGVA